MSKYNQWMNKNLYNSALQLSNEKLNQNQGAFFGSIKCYEDWNFEEHSTEKEIIEIKEVLKNPKIATDKLLSISYIEICDENTDKSILKFIIEF